MSLAESHAECYIAFQELCEAEQGSERCHSYLLDEFDKYRLWAGNVGVAHSKETYKLSLDHRLREASFYKDQVLHIFFLNTTARYALFRSPTQSFFCIP